MKTYFKILRICCQAESAEKWNCEPAEAIVPDIEEYRTKLKQDLEKLYSEPVEVSLAYEEVREQ